MTLETRFSIEKAGFSHWQLLAGQRSATTFAHKSRSRNPTLLFPESPCIVKWRSTTILCVRRGPHVAMAGDGQVTHGNTIMKADTRKIRGMLDNKVLVGFAGSTADAFALMERFEARAKNFPGNIPRAATELARDWRTDRVLRRLEALMIVASEEHSLLITGQGDVIQPTDGLLGIGSGGPYALAAARALLRETSLSAAEIARKALEIAAEIDIYTNNSIVVEELPCLK